MAQNKDKNNRTVMTEKLWASLGKDTKLSRNSIIEKIVDAINLPKVVYKELDDLILKMNGLIQNTNKAYKRKECSECNKKIDWYKSVHLSSFAIGSYGFTGWTETKKIIDIGFCGRKCLRKFMLKEIDRILDLTDESNRKEREIYNGTE